MFNLSPALPKYRIVKILNKRLKEKVISHHETEITHTSILYKHATFGNIT